MMSRKIDISFSISISWSILSPLGGAIEDELALILALVAYHDFDRISPADRMKGKITIRGRVESLMALNSLASQLSLMCMSLGRDVSSVAINFSGMATSSEAL
jgi:hypothetical protein